jgi:hypothetical protein
VNVLTAFWNVRSVPLKPKWWSTVGLFIQKSFYFHLILHEEIMLVVRKTFIPSSLRSLLPLCFCYFTLNSTLFYLLLNPFNCFLKLWSHAHAVLLRTYWHSKFYNFVFTTQASCVLSWDPYMQNLILYVTVFESRTEYSKVGANIICCKVTEVYSTSHSPTLDWAM